MNFSLHLKRKFHQKDPKSSINRMSRIKTMGIYNVRHGIQKFLRL